MARCCFYRGSRLTRSPAAPAMVLRIAYLPSLISISWSLMLGGQLNEQDLDERQVRILPRLPST